MKTLYVNWYGPFTHDEIIKAHGRNEEVVEGQIGPTREDLKGNGLYAFTGKKKGQRSDACLQYIGITERSFKARFAEPHNHWDINREEKIWLGKVINQEGVREPLENVESILVAFCQPPLNSKKLYLPNFECAVISDFFKKNMEPYKAVGSIIREIPEIVIWDCAAKKIRYTQKLLSYTP